MLLRWRTKVVAFARRVQAEAARYEQRREIKERKSWLLIEVLPVSPVTCGWYDVSAVIP